MEQGVRRQPRPRVAGYDDMLGVVDDLNVSKFSGMKCPELVMDDVPLSATAKQTLVHAREHVRSIIRGHDDRLLVVVGPTVIHWPEDALRYADQLRQANELFKDELVILLRVCFQTKWEENEGPWKGLLHDPSLNGSDDVNAGLEICRKFLCHVNSIGVGCAVEFLDTVTPQYFADCVSWAHIGDNAVESQLFRELASGLSMPVGFDAHKHPNNPQLAIDAVSSAGNPHCFLSITKQGIASIVATHGNKDAHIVVSVEKKEDINRIVEQCRKSQSLQRFMLYLGSGEGDSNNVVMDAVARGDRKSVV